MGQAINAKVEQARKIIIEEVPLNKYLLAHKYLYNDTLEGKINCPVHDENSPSCYFDVEKGVYHCFGCGSKGSVVELVTAVDKKTDDRANIVKTILKLSKEFNVKIPNMFDYSDMSKPTKRVNRKFELDKMKTKNKDVIFNRKIERLESRITELEIPDRLKAYRVIDHLFLGKLTPKDAYDKLTAFLNSLEGVEKHA